MFLLTDKSYLSASELLAGKTFGFYPQPIASNYKGNLNQKITVQIKLHLTLVVNSKVKTSPFSIPPSSCSNP